jgi:hypothetical protein
MTSCLIRAWRHARHTYTTWQCAWQTQCSLWAGCVPLKYLVLTLLLHFSMLETTVMTPVVGQIPHDCPERSLHGQDPAAACKIAWCSGLQMLTSAI